ncbi:unnamed protein product, partial [Musa hybrid cultivar]
MPNGSLDKFLYDQEKPPLDWATRFRVIKGVASGVLYLHDDWEQVIVHRDIKASNTTRVVGTIGYLAPELARTGKATTVTDVFAFGVFLLEGTILATRDPRLGEDYAVEEVELVLKLGLRCSHPLPTARPSMRQVVRYLEGHAPLAELSPTYLSFSAFLQVHNEGADDHITSYTSSVASASEEYEPLVSNNKSCPCVTLLVKEETHGMILVQPVNFACVRLMTPKPASLFALLCSLKIYHLQEYNRALVYLLLLLLHRRLSLAASSSGCDDGDDFIFNGFGGANLTLDGVASITSAGLLTVTDASMETKGHAFHPSPLRFRDLSNGTVISFSTTFAFGFISDYPGLSGHGMAFVISHTKDFSKALGSQFLGLFNQSSKAYSSSNHVLAIELDTILSPDFQDIDNNHVGIDINTLISNKSHTAGYYDDHTGSFERLSLGSGQAMQVWIDYHARDMLLNVTLAPIRMAKPHRPLLSAVINLKSVLLDLMYVGFSSSTGPWLTSHYVLGWSFKMNGVLRIGLPLASATLV